MGVPTVTSLPGSPADGDEIYYQFNRGDGTNEYWHLRYNASTTYWDFLGGPSLYATVSTAETTASATYVALTTAGPSVTLPLAGDYDVSNGTELGYTSSGNGCMSYDIGATGAIDANSVCMSSPAGVGGTPARLIRQTGLSAVTLTSKYRALSGTPSFGKRWLEATPVRVH